MTLAIPGTIAFDLGAGVGVESFSQGGTAKLLLTTGSATGTPGTTGVQVKFTGPTAPGGVAGTGEAVLAKFVNGITAQTNTITFYDSATAAGCTPANAIFTIIAAPANAITLLDLPVINGLWYAASGAFTGPAQIYFS